MLQDDEKMKRCTPAARASSARRTEARWLMSSVSRGSSCPSGSFDSAARCTTASTPVEVGGRQVAQVAPQRLHRRRRLQEVAAVEEAGVEADDRVPVLTQQRAEHGADVALMAGDQNLHAHTFQGALPDSHILVSSCHSR